MKQIKPTIFFLFSLCTFCPAFAMETNQILDPASLWQTGIRTGLLGEQRPGKYRYEKKRHILNLRIAQLSRLFEVCEKHISPGEFQQIGEYLSALYAERAHLDEKKKPGITPETSPHSQAPAKDRVEKCRPIDPANIPHNPYLASGTWQRPTGMSEDEEDALSSCC